jgi:hypothetical protein
MMVLRDYEDFYNTHRPHRTLKQAALRPLPDAVTDLDHFRVQRRDRVIGFACRHVQDSANPRASPGGSPEACDADVSAVLRREALEESQVVVTETAYLGYQEVRRPGCMPYAQVRMAGLIAVFRRRRPDTASGRLLRRLMCPLPDVPAVLGWGAIMIPLAARTARALWRETSRR